MSTLSVWRFDTEPGADEAVATLEELARKKLVTVWDAATMTWPKDAKKPKTRQLHDLSGAGALGGPGPARPDQAQPRGPVPHQGGQTVQRRRRGQLVHVVQHEVDRPDDGVDDGGGREELRVPARPAGDHQPVHRVVGSQARADGREDRRPEPVVVVVEGHPGHRLGLGRRPFGQQLGLAVAGRSAHEGDLVGTTPVQQVQQPAPTLVAR